ncbi:MAG TPA: polysaccharide deacetylase family protein [Candidatus Acidoferrum sp.]|nr:polysaccharide deacetylase family protein [Candidatus Acidoferrum sp.]
MNRRKFVANAIKAATAASCAPVLSDVIYALAKNTNEAAKLPANAEPPQLALTMDDPRVKLDTSLRWEEANSRILKALDGRNVRAALFVCGMRVDEPDGAKLISAWDQAGHMICNHSYSHLNYCGSTTYADFAVDFLKNEKVVEPYQNKKLIFRYPFLKEGNTAEKRDRFRMLLKESGYRVGHVTIDTSDWYVNQRMTDRLAEKPKTKIEPYRDYLISHLLDRASFYRQLALDVVGRDIRHTILMHYTTLNALVLPDVMAAFEKAGWQWIDASLAYQDDVFKRQPKTLPAGESLVWALAKETGKFENRLRYPGEDDVYEEPKMKALGL